MGKYTPWLSDHCPLHYAFTLSPGLDLKIESSMALKGMPARFNWNHYSKTKFEDFLQSDVIKNDFEKFQAFNSSVSLQNHVSMVTDTLMKCAQVCEVKGKIGCQINGKIVNRGLIVNV